MSLLAFYYGWTIDYIMGLSMPQFNMVLEGLGKILEQKYGSKSFTPSASETPTDIKEFTTEGLKPEDVAFDLKSMFKRLANKQKKRDQMAKVNKPKVKV